MNKYKPLFRINGETVREWDNGQCGIIRVNGGVIEFEPYDNSNGSPTRKLINGELAPTITLATGFTAYKYSHVDDKNSIQNYYNECKEAYKANLFDVAMYNEYAFGKSHLIDETEKAEVSMKLYEYDEDKDLQRLSEMYIANIKDKYLGGVLYDEVVLFFGKSDDAKVFVYDILHTDKSVVSTAKVVCKYWKYNSLHENYMSTKMYNVLSKAIYGYNKEKFKLDTYRKEIQRQKDKV